MNMHIHIHMRSHFLAMACVANLVCSQSPDMAHPAMERFREAREAAEAKHRENLEDLVSYYTAFLEVQAEAFQSRGELEPLLLILAERETAEETLAPGEAEVPQSVLGARRVFAERGKELEQTHREKLMELRGAYAEALDSTIQSLTREGRLEDAKALDAKKKAVEAQIAAGEEKPEATGERLGPNLLPGGDFDRADEDSWQVHAPGNRNKTGFHQERNSGMNQTIRVEQNPTRNVRIERNVRVKTGTKYRLTWNARMLRPWKSDILLRGKGRYWLGFRIPEHRWQAFSPLEQEEIQKTVGVSNDPPPRTDWQPYTATVVPGPWMTEFFISASKGEGEFLIDDIELREILPPEKNANP